MAKTFAIVVLIFCVSAPATSIDPTCITNFLKRIDPLANEKGLRFQELTALFPPSKSKTLAEFEYFTDIMLTCHHIIPRNTLRDFFIQTLANEEYQPRFVEFLRHMVKTSRAAGISMPATFEDTLNILHTMTGENIREFRRPVRELFALFCWMPFNFFEGPMTTYRSDDPGESMELNVQIFVNNHHIFSNLFLLNGFMFDFIANEDNRTQHFERSMYALRHLYDQRQTPYYFEPNLWVETSNENGKYHIRTPEDLPDAKNLTSSFPYVRGSLFRDDPWCLETERAVDDFFADTEFFLDKETDSMYDLSALNLVSTKEIVDAVEVVGQRNDFASWDRWYSSYMTDSSAGMCDYFLTANSNCIRFRDGSFAILMECPTGTEYKHKTRWLMTDSWHISKNVPSSCPAATYGALMFDKRGRPKAIGMRVSGFARSFHYYKAHATGARWAWAGASQNDFENIVNLATDPNDFKVPHFRLLSQKA